MSDMALFVIVGASIIYALLGTWTVGYISSLKKFWRMMYVETDRKRVPAKPKDAKRGRKYTTLVKKRLIIRWGSLFRSAGIFLFWWMALALQSGRNSYLHRQPLSNDETMRIYRERANEAMTYYGSGCVLSEDFKTAWRDNDADLTPYKDEIDKVLLNSSPVKLAEMYRRGAKIEGLKYVGFETDATITPISPSKTQKRIESIAAELQALSSAMQEAQRATQTIVEETEKRFDKLNRKLDTGFARAENVKKELRETQNAINEQYIVVDREALEKVVEDALAEAGVRKSKVSVALESFRGAICEGGKDGEEG